MEEQGHNLAAAVAESQLPPCVPCWSLPNGFRSSDLENGAVLPSAFGTQQVTYQSLGTGCGVLQPRIRLNQMVRFSATMISDRPIAVLRLPRTGRVEVTFRGAESVVERPESYGFFLHGTIDDPVNLVHQPAALCDTVVTIISEDQLSAMLAGLRVPPVVERFLNGSRANVAMQARMSSAIEAMASQLVSSPYTGDMAILYAHGKLLEILAATLNDLNGIPVTSALPHRGERGKAAAAIDLLMADLADPPSLETLACSVGLTQRRLAELFKQATGMTVVEWVVERKIEQGAALLRDGGVAIKEIAFQLGYAHVGTFTSQFTRRFGVPPAGYRRSLRSVQSGVRMSS